MSTLSALSSISPGTNRTGSAASKLGVEDLLKVLMTQLTFQDPLKPLDNQQFMAQMAQFTTLEQTQQLNQKLEALIATQSSLQSVGLLGKAVDFQDSSGSTKTGSVTQLSLAGDSPTLSIRLSSGTTLSGIPLTSISAVR